MIVAALGLMLVLLQSGSAQANVASTMAETARLQASSPVLVPLVVLTLRAAPVVVKAAKMLKAARAAKKIRRAARIVRARGRAGVRITAREARALRAQARIIAARGKHWARRNWERISPFARACFTAVVAAESIKEFWDGVTAQEWVIFISSPPLGIQRAEDYLPYLGIYMDDHFDFSKTRDVWIGACAAGMLERQLKGV